MDSAERSLPVLRGRGAGWDPPNRFERLHVDHDASTDDEGVAPGTVLLEDATRSILAFNQSPDVGFDVGINPYRGCEHGCSYCLDPETPVLYADMVWRPIGECRPGDLLVGFDEFPEPGRCRKLQPSRVETVVETLKPTLRVSTDGEEILTTAEHRWLRYGSFRWRKTSAISPGDRLRRLPMESAEPFDEPYRIGYLQGLTVGDGTYRYEPGQRSNRMGFAQPYWRVAMKDPEPLRRVQHYLGSFGVHLAPRTFSPGRGRPRLEKLETRSVKRLAVIDPLLRCELDDRSYRRGFLAGFFDAEGHNGTSLRVTQVDRSVLERVRRYAASLALRFDLERSETRRASSARLVGSIAERIRFFSVCRPAIHRKVEPIFGRMPPTVPAVVQAIEPSGVRRMVDIQTSTGTFYAGGLATHNCYARPTHEYLGFSAGLDFETKIMVKRDAPRLLRRALSSRAWKPQVIGLSGNTDAYQPVERRLRITRGCVEVLRDFRNPVAITTKSDLVTRDADVLSELADHDAAAVVLSVTSLRNDVQSVMEPRAPTPAKRLAAIETLARAGVPVGVNVAPIVPGLTDHELPEILEAAAAAGATFASYIVLRLPHGVKEIFSTWLAQRFPDRKDKVLNRVRELRGGKLYDARYAVRGRGEGPWADQMRALFHVYRTRYALDRPPRLSAAAFRQAADPSAPQTDLFASD